MRVPLVDLKAQHASLAAELAPRVAELIEAQGFILGSPVEAFEATLARLTGAAHAVGVASGSDALVLALRAAGVGVGDAVLTGAFGFVATAEAIVRVGATPIFVDVDGFVVTASSVERVLARLRTTAEGGYVDPASGAAVRAVLVAHLFGESCHVRALVDLVHPHGMAVVEDAAQAILATDAGSLVGSQGDFAALSFFPSKNLGAWGDGGAVLGKDAAAMQRVRRLRVHGLEGGRFVEVGMNSRLDALQAVVLDVKARHLEAWTRRREAVALRYREGFASLAGVLEVPPSPSPGSRHVYHQFVVRTAHRDPLGSALAAAGVQTRAYYPHPLHHEPCFAALSRTPVALPSAEAAARTALGLPIYPELTEEAQAHVITTVRRFFDGGSGPRPT